MYGREQLPGTEGVAKEEIPLGSLGMVPPHCSVVGGSPSYEVSLNVACYPASYVSAYCMLTYLFMYLFVVA